MEFLGSFFKSKIQKPNFVCLPFLFIFPLPASVTLSGKGQKYKQYQYLGCEGKSPLKPLSAVAAPTARQQAARKSMRYAYEARAATNERCASDELST
jgi:hypothetical protein